MILNLGSDELRQWNQCDDLIMTKSKFLSLQWLIAGEKRSFIDVSSIMYVKWKIGTSPTLQLIVCRITKAFACSYVGNYQR